VRLTYEVVESDTESIFQRLQMSEQDPGKLYDSAMKLKAEGNLEGCVEALQAILKVAPNHVQTHMALGVHLQKLGRFDEAIEHAKKVAELEPQDAFSFTQLSVIYQRCGKIFEAEEAMARAREIQGHVHRH
jgi:Flp pilus assembly protein TadD